MNSWEKFEDEMMEKTFEDKTGTTADIKPVDVYNTINVTVTADDLKEAFSSYKNFIDFERRIRDKTPYPMDEDEYNYLLSLEDDD